jgi:hypothetical protein
MRAKDGVSARFAEEVVLPPSKAPPFPEQPLDSLHADAECNAFLFRGQNCYSALNASSTNRLACHPDLAGIVKAKKIASSVISFVMEGIDQFINPSTTRFVEFTRRLQMSQRGGARSQFEFVCHFRVLIKFIHVFREEGRIFAF